MAKNQTVDERMLRIQSEDILPKLMRSLLTEMQSARSSERIDSRLNFCRDACQAKPGCDEKPMNIEQQLERATIGFTLRKFNDLYSWLIEIMAASPGRLYRLQPSAIPELPQSEKERVVAELKATLIQMTTDLQQQAILEVQAEIQLEQQQINPEAPPPQVDPGQALALAEARGMKVDLSPAEIEEAARSLKGIAADLMLETARAGALEAQNQITDWLQDTRFRQEMRMLLEDFSMYPYAVMQVVYKEFCVRTYDGDKWVEEDKLLPTGERVSPFDCFWTEDSTDPNDGAAFARRLKLRRCDIRDLKGQAGYNDEEIDRLLCEKQNGYRDWSAETEARADSGLWGLSESIQVYEIWALISAEDLVGTQYFEKHNLEHGVQYQVECLFCDGFILYVKFHHCKKHRGFFKSSFQDDSSQFSGIALAEILGPTERKARSVDRTILKNMGRASDPTTFRNLSFFDIDDMDDEFDENFPEPGCNYDYIGMPGATTGPVDVLKIDGNTNELRAYKFDLQREADDISGIPSLFSGQTSNSGSGVRTTGMLRNLIAQASRILKAKSTCLSEDILVPLIDDIYGWMKEEADEDSPITDATVVVDGIQGVVNEQFTQERLQEFIRDIVPFTEVTDSEGRPIIEGDQIKQLLYESMRAVGIEPKSGLDYPKNQNSLQSQAQALASGGNAIQ